MNVLVTGANGFLGRHICEHCEAKGMSPWLLCEGPQVPNNFKKLGLIAEWVPLTMRFHCRTH